MYPRSQGPAPPSSKHCQERGAGSSNVRDLLLLLLGDAGFEALWCLSLLTRAGVCAGWGEVFQGIGFQPEFWNCRIRKAHEVGMVWVGKEEV